MKREIVCEECAKSTRPMHPEDVLQWMQRRTVTLAAAKKPEVHGIEVNGEFTPMRSLVCDRCNTPISDGTGAVAVTWWNKNREGEPGPWEEEYKS